MADLSAEAPPENPVPDVLDTSAAGAMLVRGGALRVASYVGVVALSVVSAAILTRHLGVNRFGQYTTVMSLVGVLSAVTDAGMSNIGTREFAVREGTDRDLLMRDLLGLRVALTLVGVLLATAFAAAAGYDDALLLGTVAAGLGTVAIVLQHTLSIPLTTSLRLGLLSAFDFARQALSVLAILALVAAGAGVLPLLAVPLAVNLLLIPPTAALIRGQISVGMAVRPGAWRALMRLTVSFSLATAVGVIYIYTAQILTSLVASPHQSGLFAVSFRIFIVAVGVPSLLVSAALPVLSRAARDDRARLGYALQRIFDVSLIVGVGAALGFVAGAHLVIDVVAGARYAGAAEVLRIQALAMVPSFVLAGWAFGLLSLRLHRALVVVNALAFAVSCALTIILASADGARGAAIATVAGETTLAVGYLLALVRAHPEYRPEPAVIVKVAIAAAPAAALALIPDLSSALRAVVALGVYAILILLTRALPGELLELLPARLRRGPLAP